MNILLVIVGLLPAVLSQGCQTINNGTGLLCQGLTDFDLPYTEATGVYETIEISATSLTRIPAESFGRAGARAFLIADNPDLATLDSGFLGYNVQQTTSLILRDNPLLTAFNWDYLISFFRLEHFEFSNSGLVSLSSRIPWPATVSEIVLSGNTALVEVPPYAFSSALGLVMLDMSGLSGQVHLVEGAFHITSVNRPRLILDAAEGPFEGVIGHDAFGNVDGGELWGQLEVALWDFPEGAFRLMLKAHFDVGSQELITGTGTTTVRDCSNCSIAWLYKDAKVYNVAAYVRLVGAGNVVCPGVGPVLETEDPAFVQEMEACPVTEMPWPGGNACEGHGGITDTVPDSDDCRCFFKCDGDNVSGHDCCPPGLVFNPNNLICDWPASVPGCDAK